MSEDQDEDTFITDKSARPWVVRDVPEATRRKVKAYAGENGLTIAEAVEDLVDLATSERLPVRAGERQKRQIPMDSFLTYFSLLLHPLSTVQRQLFDMVGVAWNFSGGDFEKFMEMLHEQEAFRLRYEWVTNDIMRIGNDVMAKGYPDGIVEPEQEESEDS